MFGRLTKIRENQKSDGENIIKNSKQYYREKLRKSLETEYFKKILFLIDISKLVELRENVRKFLRTS